MSRILAYTSPATGHVFPLVPGLLELQRRGHAVHLRTLPSALPELSIAGLDVSPLDPRVLDVEVTDYLARTDKQRMVSGLGDVLGRAAADAADLDAAIAQHQPDVLIVDCNAYGALTRAEASGLPWALSLPSLLPLRERGIPPYSLGLRPARGPIGRIRDAVLWPMVERAYGKAMLPRLNAIRQASGLSPLRSPLDLYEKPSVVMGITGEPLEDPRTALPSNVRLVGFQPWDPPSDVPSYLDEPGAPWVLVTCSTDYQGDESLAQVAVEALRDEPYRVLLTLADAYDGARLPPAGNITVTRFVPHGPVLDRAAAVVTHSGMGIVGKATMAGVSIVCVPYGRDQPEIARRVVEAGSGLRLPAGKLTPERLRTAVRQTVRLRPRAQSVARSVRRSGAAEAFGDAVDHLIRRGQPSSR